MTSSEQNLYLVSGVLKKIKREQFERVPEPDINFAQKMSLLYIYIKDQESQKQDNLGIYIYIYIRYIIYLTYQNYISLNHYFAHYFSSLLRV